MSREGSEGRRHRKARGGENGGDARRGRGEEAQRKQGLHENTYLYCSPPYTPSSLSLNPSIALIKHAHLSLLIAANSV